MAQLIKYLSSVRLVYRRSTSLTKIVVASAVVLSMAALLVLHGALDATAADTEALRQQAIALENENSRLELYLEQKGTVAEIVRVAQEKLGLVEPDTVVIQPE